VDHVSRPFQIALVAMVLLAGMWFAVLRPKSDTASTAPAAPAPGTAGLTRAVDKANGAATASNAANAAVESATGEASAPNATATAGKPAKAGATPAKAAKPTAKAPAKASTAAAAKAAPKDRSERLLASLAKNKTVVLLFHGKGADDRAARRAVLRATRGDHRVTVASAPIGKVGSYDAITSGVDVLTSPTILVIGKDRRAVALTGYVDQRNVTQAIGDARRAAAKK
jgi:hypothetical protein